MKSIRGSSEELQLGEAEYGRLTALLMFIVEHWSFPVNDRREKPHSQSKIFRDLFGMGLEECIGTGKVHVPLMMSGRLPPWPSDEHRRAYERYGVWKFGADFEPLEVSAARCERKYCRFRLIGEAPAEIVSEPVDNSDDKPATLGDDFFS